MAVITRRWARLRWASLATRQPAPWRWKTSATSKIGRGIAGVSGRCCRLHVQKFERALDLSDGVDCHPCVAGGGRDVTMAEQILDHVNVDTLFQEMVAKLCRNVCTVIDLSSPAASTARWKTRCSWRVVIRRPGYPGNSQFCGRSRFQ